MKKIFIVSLALLVTAFCIQPVKADDVDYYDNEVDIEEYVINDVAVDTIKTTVFSHGAYSVSVQCRIYGSITYSDGVITDYSLISQIISPDDGNVTFRSRSYSISSSGTSVVMSVSYYIRINGVQYITYDTYYIS